VFDGVNSAVCNILNLINKSILIPQSKTIKKLTTYVPSKDAKKVREALFKAGGGSIGNYENCSFNSNGIGTYKGNNNSNPYFGKPNKDENLEEIKIDIIYAKHLESSILSSLFKSHPYESVAYETYTLENINQFIGMGMIGDLEKKMSENDFIKFVKKTMKSDLIRHSKFINKPIKKVAILAGSGSFAIESAKLAKADAFITSPSTSSSKSLTSSGSSPLTFRISSTLESISCKSYNALSLSSVVNSFFLSKINTNPLKYK
jgi:hypothetical protein